MQVLLAEDDRSVRESLVRALGLEGYDVRAVSNGAQALDELSERPADLVLLDVSMPIVDGLTVCRVLRSERNRVPILMLTSKSSELDRVLPNVRSFYSPESAQPPIGFLASP